MENEHVDPMYKYVDGKIELIRRELRQLKAAHDAVASQHTQALLDIHRIVAGFKINSDVAIFASIIDAQFPNKSTMRTQVLTEAAAIKSQLQTSNKPIDLAAEFHKKWGKTFRDLGADIISY